MSSATFRVSLAIALLVLGFVAYAGPARCSQNSPPVANAGGPYLVCDGQSVTIDGSQSFDPDAPADYIVSYAWDLNNDGAAERMVETSELSLSWSELNVLVGTLRIGLTYPIKLRVADSFQAWSDWSESTLQVEECPVSDVLQCWGAIKALYR